MQRKNRSGWVSGLLAAAALLLLPARAHADAGIPMLPVKYPQIVLFLVPVIMIEAAYLRSELHSRWRRTLIAVSGMNVLTMGLGYPLAWLLYVWLNQMIGFPMSATGMFQHLGSVPVWVCARIMPDWGGVHQTIWPVLVIFVLLLVPSYLLSGAIKAWIAGLFDLLHSKGNSRHAIWTANRLSYLFLAAAGCVLLYTIYSA